MRNVAEPLDRHNLAAPRCIGLKGRIDLWRIAPCVSRQNGYAILCDSSSPTWRPSQKVGVSLCSALLCKRWVSPSALSTAPPPDLRRFLAIVCRESVRRTTQPPSFEADFDGSGSRCDACPCGLARGEVDGLVIPGNVGIALKQSPQGGHVTANGRANHVPNIASTASARPIGTFRPQLVWLDHAHRNLRKRIQSQSCRKIGARNRKPE